MSTLTLEQMYEMQKALDAKIIKEKGLEGKDLLPNTVLALQVEIAELANEWRGFKHWSNDQEPRYERKCHACKGRTGFSVGYTAEGNEILDPCSYCNETGAEANPLLEEYVDCLHFFLSIARQFSVANPRLPNFVARVIEEPLTDHFTDLIGMVGDIKGWEDDMIPYEKWEMAFMSFIDLGHRLGFTFEDVAAAYAAKNAVNHERQANGY